MSMAVTSLFPSLALEPKVLAPMLVSAARLTFTLVNAHLILYLACRLLRRPEPKLPSRPAPEELSRRDSRLQVRVLSARWRLELLHGCTRHTRYLPYLGRCELQLLPWELPEGLRVRL